MTCSTGWPVSRVCVAGSNWSGPRETAGPRTQVRVFDDYAHHPTEISATLAAVRTVLEQSGSGRSLVVFQPHLYSRTKAFAAEFGRALDAADEVFVLDVYGAREQPLAGISGASVAEHVTRAGALPRRTSRPSPSRSRPPPARATSSSRWAPAT